VGASFVEPAGFKCSSGIKGSDWESYLDANWISMTTATVEECYAAAKAQFPDVEGVMFLTNPVCRAMVNFAALAPDGELKAEYPDYQGSGGICMPEEVATTTAVQIQLMDAASHVHGSIVAVTVSLAAMQAALFLF